MTGLPQALSALSRLLLRLVLVAAALVLVASLIAALALLALGWALRAAWARLTGRPVTPWVNRFDLGQQFGNVMRRAPGAAVHRPAATDITDVEVREVHDTPGANDPHAPRLPQR